MFVDVNVEAYCSCQSLLWRQILRRDKPVDRRDRNCKVVNCCCKWTIPTPALVSSRHSLDRSPARYPARLLPPAHVEINADDKMTTAPRSCWISRPLLDRLPVTLGQFTFSLRFYRETELLPGNTRAHHRHPPHVRVSLTARRLASLDGCIELWQTKLLRRLLMQAKDAVDYKLRTSEYVANISLT